LDSGILLATVQTETYTEQARTLINQLDEQQVQMIAPVLLRYECVAVARKWVYRELTTLEKAKIALNILLNYPVTTVLDDSLLNRAYQLATELDRPTAYDAHYLAVAERYQCDFWTADERLYNAVKGKFTRISWIGNIKA
jgi:predicted nucleic acid-binding protein